MQHEYFTVSKEARHETEEKKSKFIATVKPVSSEDEAINFINSIKTKYWDATHNVYAYVVRGNTTTQRFSDDGEPSGTAGLPVLEVIKNSNVTNTVIVVTRYFGGTKLGAAGLVRAYRKSAVGGLEKAGIIKMQLCFEYSIKMDYTLLGKVQNIIAAKGFRILDTIYTHEVEIKVLIPKSECEKFETYLIDATNARLTYSKGDSRYEPFLI